MIKKNQVENFKKIYVTRTESLVYGAIKKIGKITCSGEIFGAFEGKTKKRKKTN